LGSVTAKADAEFANRDMVGGVCKFGGYGGAFGIGLVDCGTLAEG